MRFYTAAIVVNERSPRPADELLAERRQDCAAKGWDVVRVFRLRPDDVLAEDMRDVLAGLGPDFNILYLAIEDFAYLASRDVEGNLYTMRDAFAANIRKLCEGLDGKAMFYFPDLDRLIFTWQLERDLLRPLEDYFAAGRAKWVAGIKEKQALARGEGKRIGRHPKGCSCGAHDGDETGSR